MSRPSLRIERVTGVVWWGRVCTFIRIHHRHHPPPIGWLWGLVVWRGSRLVAVATIGRPVARGLAGRLEVTRTCARSGGASWGACSLIYRTAGELGATVTYTLATEPGTSLIAAGWVPVARVKGRDWRKCSRRRRAEQERLPWEKTPATGDKVRWEWLPLEIDDQVPLAGGAGDLEVAGAVGAVLSDGEGMIGPEFVSVGQIDRLGAEWAIAED